eukprot:scaffold18416_cov63-Attheya_sp.AAC.2
MNSPVHGNEEDCQTKCSSPEVFCNIDRGDTNGEFVKLEYPSLCRGYIKGPPSAPESRRVPHSYNHMARLTSNAIHTNPNTRPKLIGNIAEDKPDLPVVVHMLESMKEFDPDSRIFLKVFPDTVNPNYFRNPTEYTRSLRRKSVVP